MDEWSRRSDLNRGPAVSPAIRADRARVVFPGHVISTSQCLVYEQSAHKHRDRTRARARDHGSVRRANQDIYRYLTPVGRMAHTFDMAKGKDEAPVFNDGACSSPPSSFDSRDDALDTSDDARDPGRTHPPSALKESPCLD